MSKKQEPRKPQSKRLNLSKKAEWKRLLKEVNKDNLPINVINLIIIHLKDNSKVEIDVDQILREGMDPEALQIVINEKLDALDDYIDDVDFHVDIDVVAKIIQPFTDKLLKDL
jgi:hypothetical protein